MLSLSLTDVMTRTTTIDASLMRMLQSLVKFLKVGHYLPFLELYRATLKSTKKDAQKSSSSSRRVVMLKEVMRLIDCHVFIKNG